MSDYYSDNLKQRKGNNRRYGLENQYGYGENKK